MSEWLPALVGAERRPGRAVVSFPGIPKIEDGFEPMTPASLLFPDTHAGVAQLVERVPRKDEVIGSSPISGSSDLDASDRQVGTRLTQVN